MTGHFMLKIHTSELETEAQATYTQARKQEHAHTLTHTHISDDVWNHSGDLVPTVE
jgi:purine-nucleoside phosphorylase